MVGKFAATWARRIGAERTASRCSPWRRQSALAVAVCGWALGVWCEPARVQAQSCHTASLRPTSGLTYRAAAAGVFGSFDNAGNKGEYQGWFAFGSVAHEWFFAELALPVYRIAQIGSHAYGLGDVALDARGNLYHSPDRAFVAGPELAATLPSGDPAKGLGMGHVMLMPGAFMGWQQGSVALLVQLAYGRALMGGGSGHAHEHMDPMPIVNPMNRSELENAISASAALHPNLRVTGRLFGAVPLYDHRGTAREVFAPGLQLIAGVFDAALELQLPLLGNPFSSRTVVSVGAQW